MRVKLGSFLGGLFRSGRSVVAAALVGGLIATTSQLACAQEGYLPPLPMDEQRFSDRAQLRDLERKKGEAIRSKTLDDATREAIRAYIQDYLVPWLTRPENFGSWQSSRTTLREDLRRSQPNSAEVHDYMANLVFAQMRSLVEQNYHPIIRVNAMIMIGDLNEKERVSGMPVSKPLPATLAYLREQIRNPQQIDAVRIAALAAVLRHVESYWLLEQEPRLADDIVRELTAEMRSLLESPPPEGRSADAHAWIQARAADILGALAGWIPDEGAFQAMAKLLQDEQQPLWLRCRVAYALSRVKYADLPNVANVDWPAIAAGLAGTLADVCRQEEKYLEQEQRRLRERQGRGSVPGAPSMAGGFTGPPPPGEPGGLAGGGAVGLPPPPGEMDAAGGIGFPASGMGMMPYGPWGMSAFGGLPKHKVDASRGRLIYQMNCVEAALVGPTNEADVKGIKPLAETNERAARVVRTMETVLAELRKVATAKDVDLQALQKTLRTRAQELDQFRPQANQPEQNPTGDTPAPEIP